MSGKRFKGKLCVYCAERPSVTGDHVFARAFFTKASRDNLPQVPTCEPCNNEKSKLEHYLATVLPFGGRHADAITNLAERVPSRLAQNQRLARELRASRGRTWELERGLSRETMTIPFDSEMYHLLFEFIGRALAWYYWHVYLRPDHTSRAIFPCKIGTSFFDKFFCMTAANRVHENLGNGTVEYIGVQAIDPPELTLWRLQFYGGIAVSGASNAPEEIANEIVVITGPTRLVNLLAPSTRPQSRPDN